MGRYIVLVLLVAAGFVSHAGDLAQAQAEDFYFSTLDHQNLKEWITELSLTAKHKNQIQAYLKGHQLEQVRMPRLHWQIGSMRVTVGSGSSALDVRFEKSQVMINGKSVTIDTNGDFNEVMKKVHEAIAGHGIASSLELLIPRAEAVDPKEMADQFVGAVAAWTPLDQIFACTGHEATTAHECALPRSNAAMIQSDVGRKTQILAFNCDGNKFSSFTYQKPGLLSATLAMKYDDKGSLSAMNVLKDGNVICNYPVKDGTLAEDTLLDECGGRMPSDRGSLSHPIDMGQMPKTIWAIDIPIKRAQDCCADERCKKAMAEAVAKSKAAGAVHAESAH